MWTPTELASEASPAEGTVWRVVEHQYTTSTHKIVDSQAEQDALELILEENKPPNAANTERLHYLLKTPFRYQPPPVVGSRFRRAHASDGVFYGSETLRTALAELSYYRLKFFSESPNTPVPRAGELLTAFTAAYTTPLRLDLTTPPLNRSRKRWTHPTDYSATQALADDAREAAIEVIRYESVRDKLRGFNLAMLTPRVFTGTEPVTQQSWILYLTKVEVSCVRATDKSEMWAFPRNHFRL